MKSAVSSRRSAVIRRKVFLYCLLLTAYCSLSCSIPNLEKHECTAAREAVRDFYSYHFGNDMKFTRVNLRQREKFLSRQLIKNLSAKDESAFDYFTATDDYPKAFRVGGCTVVEAERRAKLGVALFWKTDTRSEQKEIGVEAIEEDGKWVIDKVAD